MGKLKNHFKKFGVVYLVTIPILIIIVAIIFKGWIDKNAGFLTVVGSFIVGWLIPIFVLAFKYSKEKTNLKIYFSNDRPYLKAAPTNISNPPKPSKTTLIVDRIEIIEEAIWVRFIIKNEGSITAKNCEARLEKIYRNGICIENFDPILLHWVGTPGEYKSRDDSFLDIKQDAEEKIDLCYFFRENNIKLSKDNNLKNLFMQIGVINDFEIGNDVIIYDPNFQPRANIVKIAKTDELIFNISVRSDNANTVTEQIKIIPVDCLEKLKSLERIFYKAHVGNHVYRVILVKS